MEKRNYSEERQDLIVGLVTIAIFLALFLWLLISIGNSSRNTVGSIASKEELTRGSEQELTYVLDRNDVKDGDKVEWSINGRKVGESIYEKGEGATFNFTPDTAGSIVVKARIGKYSQTTSMEVKSPHLTVTAPNITITYGEALPKLECDIVGIVEGEEEQIDCANLCKIDAESLNVGVYTLNFPTPCQFLDYEMEFVTGTLTVLPRELRVEQNFYKVYDGTNTIIDPKINLVGVRDGDEVTAKCDVLYFDSKNAGDRQIMLANVELTGKDACNYTLCAYAEGRIFPKPVEIVGLTVKDKIYDGTTKATIDTMGVIKGVCEGDSVAIGNISVSFEDAGIGKRQFVANNVVLIGADKDNYRISSVETGTANINTTLMQRLTQRDPVAQGAN